MREVALLSDFDVMDGGAEICGLLADFGTSCVACASDGQPYCSPLEIQELTGKEVSTSFQEVAAADCPDCELGTPVCSQ